MILAAIGITVFGWFVFVLLIGVGFTAAFS
jgi:hypothetical protein